MGGKLSSPEAEQHFAAAEEAKSKSDDTGKKETKKADSKKESKAEGTAKKENTKASAPKESSPKKAAAA